MRNASNLRSTLVLSLVALVLPAFEPPAQNTQAQIQAPSSNVCSVEISSPNPGDKVGPSTTVKVWPKFLRTVIHGYCPERRAWETNGGHKREVPLKLTKADTGKRKCFWEAN